MQHFQPQKEQNRIMTVVCDNHYFTGHSLGCYCFLFCSKSMWIVQDKPLSWVGTWKEMFNRLLNIYIYYSHITPSHLYIALNDVIQVIHLEFSWFLQYWLPHLHKMNRINCYKSKNIRLPGYILLDANENGFVPTSLK